jgi:Flp pilus assembly protein CpaB
MKRKNYTAALILFVICCTFLAATGCGNKENNQAGAKQPLSENSGQDSEKSQFTPRYKDGFVPTGMRAVSFGVFNNNILGKEFLSPGCLADIIVEQKLSKSGINSSTTSTTLFRKIQILDVSSCPEYQKSTLIRASLTEQQAEILIHGYMNGSISLRALEPLKKLPPSDSPKNLPLKPLPGKPSSEL